MLSGCKSCPASAVLRRFTRGVGVVVAGRGASGARGEGMAVTGSEAAWFREGRMEDGKNQPTCVYISRYFWMLLT